MFEILIAALGNVFQPSVLFAILACSIYGIFMGAIPGLTATMAVALLVPMTFFLSDLTALAAIVTLEACAIFAGDIPTVLLRIPGTPSSAAYVDDAHALTQRGKHFPTLGLALTFSVFGGLFGACLLFALAPSLARIAFHFTSYEYFWLTLLGLSCAAFVSTGSLLKGTVALLIGLLLSMVGLSEVHSIPRFTFGQDELIQGVDFIPAMIGLFGLSEVLKNMALGRKGMALSSPLAGGEGRTSLRGALREVFGQGPFLILRRKFGALRSALIGFFVGMLPGAGADIGAWISFAASKRFSRTPEEYGRGSLEGIGDATAANNAALAGAWVPSLVFGIPGDSVTAIVIGVLLMKNVIPGPHIFTQESQAVLVYGIFITFILANLVLLPVGFLAIRSGALLVKVPRTILIPSILIFCIVGSYSINGSYFDIGVMVAMGLLGLILDSVGIPLGPVVLGIILGGRLEETFIQSLTKSASYSDFFTRPASALLGLATILLWLSPLWMRWSGKKRS